MSTGHPESDRGASGAPSSNPADSAGNPFAGRTFEHSTSAFDGDDGTAPQAILDALERFRAGRGGQADVVDAVRDARLLVALVAHAGETEPGTKGLTVDKTQELSIVTVVAPDGRAALPVFTSTTAMAAWNPSARPIPTDSRRVALSAVAEQTDLLILDPTSATEFAIRRPASWAIAKGERWVLPVDDAVVQAEFRESVRDMDAVAGIRIEGGDPQARLAGPEVVVVLELVAGLDQARVTAVIGRLQQRWGESAVIAERVDSLGVRLVAAPSIA